MFCLICFGKISREILFCPQGDSHFESITEVLRQHSDDQVEVYWIAKRFYVFSREIASDFVLLQEMTFNLMKKENPKLHKCDFCNFFCRNSGG